MSDDIRVIDNPASVLLDLERMWADCPPKTYSGKPMSRLIDSAHDQATVGRNPYWDIVRQLPLDRIFGDDTTGGHAIGVDGYACRIGRDYVVSRNQLAKTYAWAIPTPGDISWIASLLDGRGVVEVGAGTGYWAWQLSQAGVDVAAFDIKPLGNHWCGGLQYHQVVRGGVEVAGDYSDRALMLCWPPYDSAMAVTALRAYSGDLLIYIGEQDGGCTANDEFFMVLNEEWESLGSSPKHVTFGGIHCFVKAYRRAGGVS